MAGNSYPQPGGKYGHAGPYLVSVILTLNEETNVSEAIGSVGELSDQVIVVDSGSTDRTVDTAVSRGATVWHRRFDSEFRQRNWVLDKIALERPSAWVLELDADERVSAQLAAEISRLMESGPLNNAYLVTLRFRFDGRLLRFGGFSRTRVPRLRRVDSGRYEERDVNPHLILTSHRLGHLEGHIIHSDVVGWEKHIDKHNRYSSLEARSRFRVETRPELRVRTSAALRSPHLRRRWIRDHVWNRLPAKPLLLFLLTFVIFGGWLDGRPGLRNAVFRSWHAMCIDLKFRELGGHFADNEPRVSTAADHDLNLVVCILTLNEEAHIGKTVASSRLVTNDVVVVDSFSSDRTHEIAQSAGARVWPNEFESWGRQRNWALDRIEKEFKDPWVLFLDADERLSQELVDEFPATLRNGSPRYDAYLLRHTLVFAGRPLRFGGFSGTRLLRLLRASSGRHEERPVNDHLILRAGMKVGSMKGRIIHLDVHSWERYIAKQNRYTTLEAGEVLRREYGNRSVTLREAVKNPPLRRRWLRETVWPRVPAKPLIRFTQVYLLSGGVFDGYAGLCMATTQAMGEMSVELKAEEFRRNAGRGA